MGKLVHVAAAVILDDAGRIFLARRPDDKHQGGLWEFPGGKVEAGEPVLDALSRELDEELGITVQSARPLIQVPYHYPDKSVLLDVFVVDSFSGDPYGREGQATAWVEKADLAEYAFPAANQPILDAVLLPSRLMITGHAGDLSVYLEKVSAGIAAGAEGVMLRAKHLDDAAFEALAGHVMEICRGSGVLCTLNCSVERANALHADAVHLSSARLMALQSRDQFSGRWLSASCHNQQELEHAKQVGVDFVTLSPVEVTKSHPETAPMGWELFADLAADVTMPVFALGGMNESHLNRVWQAGGQGVASISAWWV